MIRINLLPFRAARKQENIRRQISVFFLFLGFLFLVGGYFFMYKINKISALEEDRDKKVAEKAAFQETLRKIRDNEQKIQELRSKLDVIRKLEDNKSGPYRMLVEIAQAVPKDKLWLRSIVESKGILTIQGTAMDNDTVALFMTNLEKAEHITAVDLTTTKLENMKKYNVNVAEFVLRCKTYLLKVEKPPEVKRKKGKKRKK